MVTGTAQAHDHGQDRCHAGGRRDRLLGPFQRRNTLFEGAHGRIGVARVDIAWLFTSKYRSGFGRTAKHIAGTGEQRLAMLTFRGAPLPGTHCQGIETHAVQIAVQATRLPFLRHDATSLGRWPSPRTKQTTAA